MTATPFRFHHGLGDAANFARMAQLYFRRGHRLAVECTPDKRWLFRSAGFQIVEKARTVHGWGYPSEPSHHGHGHYYAGNKIAANISRAPLPDIGPRGELWDELSRIELDLTAHVSDQDARKADWFLAQLPRPVVLFHPVGNTDQKRKSLPADFQRQFLRELCDRMPGTVIVLDWDNRCEVPDSYRIRHLNDYAGCSIAQLVALIDRADLMIGVDSGPLHLAGLTGTPTVGVWNPGHYPSTYLIPRDRTLSVVLEPHTRQWNHLKRIPFNIITQPGEAFDPAQLAGQALQMLRPPQYLPADFPAADIQLRQFLAWCGANYKTVGASGLCDRRTTFEIALAELAGRDNPTIVETGTIRAAEDWPGAGFSTYLFAAFLYRHGGQLHSVDLSPQHCRFAREWLIPFGDVATVHDSRGDDWLRSSSEPIDLFYADSCDTEHPQHREVCLQEVQAAAPRMKPDGIIIIDDTPHADGQWTGKGALAIPWLTDHGWRVRQAGYQVLLDRAGRHQLPPAPPVTVREFTEPARPITRRVVYTACFGDRDQLRDPPKPAAGVEYLAFTDRDWPGLKTWRIIRRPSRFACPRMRAREIKLQPHRLIGRVEAAIWQDASIDLAADPSALIEQHLTASDLAAFAHPERAGWADECDECRRLTMDDPETLTAQAGVYRAAGCPTDSGLWATGLLIQRHTPELAALFDDWWSEVATRSWRDQISLPYAAWRRQFTVATIPGDPHRSPELLTIHPHTGD